MINIKSLTTTWATVLLLLATVSLAINLYGTFQTFSSLHETTLFQDTGTGSEPLPGSLEGVHKIVCVGDSITRAEFVAKGYVSMVQDYLKILYPGAAIEVENAGVNGATSADVLAHFESNTLSHHPDLITINIGINDVHLHKGALTSRQYEENMSRILDLAKKAKAPVLLLSPTPITEDPENNENKLLLEYIQVLKHLAEQRHLPFVDNYTAFRNVIEAYRNAAQACDNVVTVDGIHPNRLGHRLLANRLMMALGISSAARLRVKESFFTSLRN